MQLLDSFISTIRSTFRESGDKFLAGLPDLIAEASRRWGLTGIQAVPNLSYNYVAFAMRGREDVVLKVGVPHRELTSEIAALKWFNGNGACQLLESDEERGLLLLERLKPGRMLSELEDDDERTHIAAELMQKRWRLPQESSSKQLDSEQQAVRLQKFIQLSDWFDGLKKLRPHFNGGTGPFPKKLLERVESSLPELFADTNMKLMHGDFHHFNILSSERGWLVIDPKGVIGPVGYEVGPLMLNPWNSISDRTSFRCRAERRVSILAERLGWERETIIKWSTAHAILSAWWSIQDDMDGDYSIQCAEIFSEMK